MAARQASASVCDRCRVANDATERAVLVGQIPMPAPTPAALQGINGDFCPVEAAISEKSCKFVADMKEVKIKDAALRAAAAEGMDAFIKVFVDGIRSAVGGQLTAEAMGELNSDQLTLLAYDALHEEVMDGGFVQLIHNGYGGFIFRNPFAKAVKQWGLRDLAKLVYNAGALYARHHEEIERDCSDEEFMALFERFPEFDDLDDEFVENEEEWTAAVAHYVDENIGRFATIEANE